jgi:hypothetical protein
MRDILKNKYADYISKAKLETDHPRNTFSFKNKTETGKQKEILNLLKPRKTSVRVNTNIDSFEARKKMNNILDEYFDHMKHKSIIYKLTIEKISIEEVNEEGQEQVDEEDNPSYLNTKVFDSVRRKDNNICDSLMLDVTKIEHEGDVSLHEQSMMNYFTPKTDQQAQLGAELESEQLKEAKKKITEVPIDFNKTKERKTANPIQPSYLTKSSLQTNDFNALNGVINNSKYAKRTKNSRQDKEGELNQTMIELSVDNIYKGAFEQGPYKKQKISTSTERLNATTIQENEEFSSKTYVRKTSLLKNNPVLENDYEQFSSKTLSIKTRDRKLDIIKEDGRENIITTAANNSDSAVEPIIKSEIIGVESSSKIDDNRSNMVLMPCLAPSLKPTLTKNPDLPQKPPRPNKKNDFKQAIQQYETLAKDNLLADDIFADRNVLQKVEKPPQAIAGKELKTDIPLQLPKKKNTSPLRSCITLDNNDPLSFQMRKEFNKKGPKFSKKESAKKFIGDKIISTNFEFKEEAKQEESCVNNACSETKCIVF